MAEWININVRFETKKRLDKFKGDKQSYDSLINETVNYYEQLPTIKDKVVPNE